MSGPTIRDPGAREHERARELAAARPDGFLDRAEVAWLDVHLAGCGTCRAVADEYENQSRLFAPARLAMPDAPRDLWARTAAAIEAEGRPGRARQRRGLGVLTFAPLAGALVVAVAVGAGLLNGLPARESTSKGEEPDATPFLLEAGEVTVVTRGADGTLEIRRQVVQEVCPIDAASCGLNPTPEVTTTEPFAASESDTWSAIISPDSGNVVVMDRGGTPGVYVLPLNQSTPAPTEDPATQAPATEPPTATPTEPAGTPSPSPADTPATSPAATSAATPDPGKSTEPSADPSPSDIPTPSNVPSATPDPTAGPTSTPSPSVEVTPRPDGAIEIASDVFLVGSSASYSPDGSHFAFTARPADESAGPDVYVWRVGEKRAHAITNDHASQFSDWLDDDLLVSRVEDGAPRTVAVSTDGRSERSVHRGPMWRPTVGPGERSGVWWDGSVEIAPGRHSWTPAGGTLVLEPWPAGEHDKQVLAGTGITDWQVQWDPDGTLLAVWTTTSGPGQAGMLSLYRVDPETGTADLDTPKLDAAPAFEGFSLRSGRLTWSAPAEAGDATVQVLAWDGDTFGRLEIPTEGGTTVVR